MFAAACGAIYGPVKEAEALMVAKDDIVSNWSKTIEADPSEKGLAEARKYFESKKADLTARRDAVKNASQGMNVDWKTNLNTHDSRVDTAMDAIKIKLGVGGGYDVGQQFDPLRKDFEAAVAIN
jgi:hypothetical protein